MHFAHVCYDEHYFTDIGELLYEALAFDRYRIPHVARKRIETQLKKSKLFERHLLKHLDNHTVDQHVSNQRVIFVANVPTLVCHVLEQIAKQIMRKMERDPSKRDYKSAEALLKIANMLTALANGK